MVMGLGGLGVDPRKLQQVQQTSQHISATIEVDYSKGKVNLQMSSEVPQAAQLIPELLKQFSESLATQLSSFFAIKGEIIETGK